jgi:two-component system, LytTR family, response regulator
MEHLLTALVLDDEESARKLLVKLLEETSCFNEIRMASSVNAALEEMNDFNPDIIFLDIKMPGKDGFSFVEDLPKNSGTPKIVFVTAYDQYAIKAIKTDAFDYILKPVNRKELEHCVVKFAEGRKEFREPVKKQKQVSPVGKIPRIRINTKTGTMFINPSSILFCKAEGNYTTVCTGDREHLCSMNIGKIEVLLKDNGFIRLGRSYMINYEYITLIDWKESTVILARGKDTVTVRIPRQHLKELETI